VGDPLVATLDSTGAPYELIPCDPALADTAQFCAAYGYALEDSANTILVIGKSDPPVYAACVVLASTRLDVNKAVKKELGVRRASFAPAEDTQKITGMAIGGVTPFGLPDGLLLLIDSRVMTRAKIILGGGSRDRKILAAPEILTATGGKVVEGLAKVLT
jgi:prolyl-tRNA editing enzyme YbaK/EbsC (Cys-tRNA(Pro) deacylase)